MSQMRPEDFRKAADIIRRRGLARETYEDHETGAHCTIGALLAAKGESTWRQVQPHVDHLGEMIGADPSRPAAYRNFVAVTHFNDEIAEGPDDVILLLEQAAEKLEADQS